MEDRTLLSTVNWINPGSGNWATTSNWQDAATGANRLPTAGDDVVIPALGSGVIITHSSGSDTVHSVTSGSNITLSGGTLNVTGNLQESSGAQFTLEGGTLANATLTSGSTLALSYYGGRLAGVTVAAGATLDGTQDIGYVAPSASVSGGLTLDGTLDLGAANGNTYGQLYFQGTQSLAGTGTVVFGGSGGNALYAQGNGGTSPATLTVGSGIAIQGGSGAVSGYYATYSSDSVTLDGAINIGSGGDLTIGGVNWINNGTITANGATVNLGGSFTTAALGNFSDSGGTVNLTGTLDNAGTTFTLSPSLGAWVLRGGTLDGGTLASTGGSTLALSYYGGRLAGGVTIASGTTLDGTQDIGYVAPSASVSGGLTLDGTLDLGAANGGTSGQLYFQGTQSLAGTGTVVFGGSGGNALYAQGNGGTSPATLTVGSGISIQGGSGTVGGYYATYSTDSVALDGSIAIGSGGNLTVGGVNWVNNGTITANGATVNLGGSFTTAALGNFTATGATVNLTGTLDNAGTTFTLSPALGAWVLRGGALDGGTLASTGGSTLALSYYGGRLAGGLTVASGTTLDGTQDIGYVAPSASVSGGLTLDGTLDLGAANGTTYGQLYFQGTQSLAGTGTVAFGSNGANALYAQGNGGASPATLTVGSGITVQGGSGTVGGYYATYSSDSVTLDGAINIGGGGNLTIGGVNWVNNGTITADGATVNLGGSFTTAALGNFTASGATVNLTGTLDNAGTTFTLSPSLGAWVLHGGTVYGGTLASTGGSTLALSYYGGRLAGGLTVASGTTLDGTQNIGYVTPNAAVSGGLTLDGTLDLGAANGGTSGQLYFQGSQTLAGTGTVVFGGNGSNALYAQGNGGTSPATLTVGSGITVQGGSGTVGGYYATYSSDSVALDGAINVSSGGDLTVGGVNWVNNGTITADDATVNLGGSFTTAALGNFTATAATVNLTGTLDNAGTTFTLSPALGAWVLRGGALDGGTLASTGGSTLALSYYGGRLAGGVTIASGTTLDGTQDIGYVAPSASVSGGLTLDGTLDLGAANGGTYGQLYFQGSQTLSGSGTVVFGSNSGNALYAQGNGGTSPATLTVGSGITVQGGSGTVSGYYTTYSNDSVTLDGTAAASTSGEKISIGSGGSKNTLSNFTAMTAVNGATISVPESLQINGSSIVTVSPNSSLTVSGNLLGTTQNPALFNPQGTITLNGSGTASSPQLLEAMSADLGSGPSGFLNNFAYGTLILANNTYVELVDQSHNSSGSGAEAVYVNSLVVPTGTTLNLNGLNLYVRDAQIAGTITGGSITQIPNAGPLALNSPTPGKLSTAGELDDWTFFERAGHSLTVALDPGSGAAGGPISPTLQWAQVQLLDPSGNVLATANGSTAGAVLTLSNITLPSDGTYTIAVKAATSHTASTGDYVVAAYDVTPNVQPLNVNQTETGTVSSPYATNQWTFSATAATQVKFNLLAESASGLNFTLTGPNGFTGFSNLTGSSGLVTLPTSGTYTLTVVGTGGAVGSYAFEMAQTNVTALALGVPYQETLAGSGQAQLFQVTVGAANPLEIDLTDANQQDQNEVYVSYGTAPTRDTYDYRFTGGPAADHTVVLTAQPGTYYILVYNNLVKAPGSYTIEAQSAPFLLSGMKPATIGNAHDTTIQLSGVFPLQAANGGYVLSSNPTVQLIDANGNAYPMPPLPLIPPAFGTVGGTTGGVNPDGTMTVSAVVPGGLLLPGTYSVRVTDDSGYSQTLANVLTVVQGGLGVLKTNVIVPNPIGYHVSSTIYVQYSNVGDAPIAAPLLVLTATQNGVAGALMTLDESKVVSGFWTSSTPDGYSQSVQILASGAVGGILQPGESETVPVYYAGWLTGQWDFSRPPIDFTLGVLDDTNTQTIDWSSLQNSLRPASISQTAWNALYPNLTAQFGNTWGSYVQQLDAAAGYLSSIGENVDDIGQLFNFEVQQANGYSPLSSLASATDAQVAAPGLPLSFARTFAPGIINRNQFGNFGWGWSNSWDTHLTVDPDGSVNVYGPDGSLRRFQPDSRGGYFDQAGDHGTLAKLSGGGYTLTELDGQVTGYNPDGTLNYVQDANGIRITASYTNGLLTRLTHSSGQFLALSYNAAGLVSSITDSDGRTTTYNYDSTNQYLTSVVDFDGQTTYYTYDEGSNPATAHALLSVTHSDGSHDYFSYDTQGRLADAHRDGGADDTAFAYYEGKVGVTDALGDTTNYYFDNRGLLVQVENPLQNTVHYTYDNNFNLVKTTDAAGQVYTNTYDNYGDLTSSTDPLGHTVTYAYNCAYDTLASVTDGNGNTTLYAYDGRGNLTSTTYADGTVESVAYDPIGNVLSSADRMGQVTAYTHDAAGNILTETFADGSKVVYTYDSHENLTSATDSTGTTVLTYDANDRLIQITYPSGHYLKYSYDQAGRRTQMVDDTGFTVNYSYDAVGNLATLTDGSGNLIVRYTYDAAGRLSREDHGNGTYVTYQYDAAGELLHLINYAPDSTINSRFDYTYDSLGRRITEATLDGTWTYSYDAIGELTHAVFVSTNPNIANQDLAYSYDAAGNRTQTVINGVTTVYTTNDLNEYTQVGGTTYTYNADGDMTSATDMSGTTSYTYNVQNQLVGVTGPSGSWTYQYDVFGNRVGDTQNGQPTQCLIDPTGLSNVVATYNGSGGLIAHYTYGFGLVNQVDVRGAVSYFDFDATNSTVAITSTGGVYTQTFTYLPFGQTLTSVGSTANPFQFVGQLAISDDGSSLDFMRARYYSATQGRFESPDPLGIGGGDVNAYRYAFNDAVNYSDPLGLFVLKEFRITFSSGAHGAGYGGSISASIHPFDPSSFITYDGANPEGVVGSWVDVGGQIGVDFGGDPGATFTWSPKWSPIGFSISSNGNIAISVGRGVGLPVSLTATLPPAPKTLTPGASGSSTSVNSHDPNSKTGPAGYGSQDFVSPTNAFPYRIDFENSPTATAPAQRVDVTDQLAPNLDWSTFQWTGFGFGDTVISIPPNTQHYETTLPMTYNGVTFRVVVDLNLDPATGKVSASFQSLNAANLMTGPAQCPGTLSLGPDNPFAELPPPVTIGFLPPENGTGRGMGYLTYTVKPKSDLATGTQIRNVADVTFDHGNTIATDQVSETDPTQGVDPTKQALVTIDSVAPTSSVAPLPAISTTNNVTVSWSGIDDPGGSGVGSYTIYVSDNGGAFTPWLTDTTATSAAYTGVNGHTYGFYSVATDNVGNQQAPPAGAQATTTIQTQVATTVALASDYPSGSTYGQTVTFTATVSPAATTFGPPTGSVQFQIDGANFGSPVTLVNGTASVATSSLTAGSHSINAIYTSDTSNFRNSSTANALTQVVNPAPLLVTADNQSKVYGAPLPTLTASFSGFVNGETAAVLSGSPTLATGAGQYSSPGMYPITVDAGTLADPNYAFQFVNGTLTVNKASTGTTVVVSASTPLAGVDSVTLTTTVTIKVPGSGSLTGSVDFYDTTTATDLGSADLVNGVASLNAGPLTAGSHTITATYSGDGNFLSSSGTTSLTALVPASLSGTVFADFNDDGQIDFGENGISGVSVNLTGTDDLGHPVNRTLQTDGDGAYAFLNLRPGTYYLTRTTQPAGYTPGIDSVGTAGGSLSTTALDQFFIQLTEGVNGLNYNYGERPAATGPVQRGQTAGIGFWNNKNGQALILAFNGGTGTQLGDWLAATFVNLYGANSDNDLAGKSNAYIAALFRQDFRQKGPKLDAQVLATALSVYATNATLDSTHVAANYGFTVSGYGVGTATFNVRKNGDAFGVADHTSLTVMDLLLATDKQAVGGLLFNGDKTRRNEANDVFSALNESGSIS